jgi:hypothetical protein
MAPRKARVRFGISKGSSAVKVKAHPIIIPLGPN